MVTAETASSKNNGKSRRVLAIVGMHRSGTSLAAIVSGQLGVAMGQDLMPANDFNQDGYAEDIYVVQQHDQLMAALGRPWNTMRGTLQLPTGWTESAEFDKARENLASYLTNEFSRVGDQIWAVKDPRISFLLPLWLRLASDLGFQLLPVLCVRSPDAVAASLEKRDGMPTDISRLIWLQYNAAIVKNIGQTVKVVLNYDSWFNEPNRNLSYLATALGQELTAANRDKIVNEIISSDLRHHSSVQSTGLFGLWQSLLEKWAADQTMPPQLNNEAQRFSEFLEVFEKWRCAIVDENATSKIIDALKRERDQVVAAADENLKAYRIVERERDEVIAVANENLKAYRTVDAALDAAKDKYTDLNRRYELITRKFSRFPLSLLLPR